MLDWLKRDREPRTPVPERMPETSVRCTLTGDGSLRLSLEKRPEGKLSSVQNIVLSAGKVDALLNGLRSVDAFPHTMSVSEEPSEQELVRQDLDDPEGYRASGKSILVELQSAQERDTLLSEIERLTTLN